MTDLVYDPSIIAPAIGDIKAAATDLHRIHGDINGSVTTVKTTWQAGTDLEKFSAYHAAWENIFVDINVFLEKLGGIAQGCLDNAMECERVNANQFPDV